MTPEVRRFFFAPAPLIITKANVVSRVHRRAHMDYIGIKTYRARRQRSRARSASSASSPRRPMCARRARSRSCATRSTTVLAASGYPPASHAGKALLNILDTFPRDELFQIGVEQLQEWSEGILDLETRPRVRVFARIDRFDRFVSLLVYVPRDRYKTGVRERIGALLAEAYKGRIAAFYPYFPEGPLVRVQFIVGRYAGATPQVDVGRAGAPRSSRSCAPGRTGWPMPSPGVGPRAEALLAKYGTAFSAGYAETFPAERALRGYRAHRAARARISRSPSISIASRTRRAAASTPPSIAWARRSLCRERVPVLENLGFSAIDERSYHIRPRFADGVRDVTLHDMVLETADGAPIELERPRQAARGLLPRRLPRRGRQRRLQSPDRLGRRRLARGRPRCGPMPPTCASSARRSACATSPTRSTGHAGLAARSARAVPSALRSRRASWPCRARRPPAEPIRQRIEGALAAVPSLDEDRILRQFLNLVGATVRTNFYQAGRRWPALATLAFKLDSKARGGGAAAAPVPRDLGLLAARRGRAPALCADRARRHPLVGPGAGLPHRGAGARARAARQECRDRALRAPRAASCPSSCRARGSRDEVQKEGIAAYRIFISRAARHHRQPEGRQDRAAAPAWCATTATIPIWWSPPTRARPPSPTSPTRSRLRTTSGWATPSPPAARPATTTRAWRSPRAAPGSASKRHFREMDIDIQRQPFRVVGVGDMSGDVFGNGMLLSQHIQLVAAFDHRDIFIDPDPGRPRLRRAQAPVRAAALELAGLRQGQDLQGRRRLLALAPSRSRSATR